jgi:uncharacterized protein (DUF2384 family)
MGLVFRLIELFWLILPVAGVIIAGLKAWSAYEKRRATNVAEAPARIGNDAAARREISRAIDAHNTTDKRWLDYEMDVGKLLDFPMMTDMREPMTVRFHQAKLRADMLRPVTAEDLVADRLSQAEYLEAVQHYVAAFDAAETEAMRRRRSDFSADEQQRLARAQRLLRLACDPAATQEERRHAYDRARTELEGLIVLPANTRAGLEGGISGQIEP